MGFFNKPFYKNNNSHERRDWFSKTKPWNRIDSGIIDALINKFGEDPMFEAFVIVSMDQNLVTRYEQLNKLYYDQTIICAIISGMLCEVGAYSAKKMIALSGDRNNIEEMQKHHRIVRATFETAIILDKKQISAYSYLASVFILLNKF